MFLLNVKDFFRLALPPPSAVCLFFCFSWKRVGDARKALPARGLLCAIILACWLHPRANPCQQAGQGGQTQGNPEKAEMEKTMSYSIPVGALCPLGILEKGKVERARLLAMWQPQKHFALVSQSINRMQFTLPCACFLFT